jgi:hypothetical protein
MLQFLLNTQRLKLGLKAILGSSLQTSVGCDGLVYYLDGYDLVADKGYEKSNVRLSHTGNLPAAIRMGSRLRLNCISVLFEDGSEMADGVTLQTLAKDIDRYMW